MKSKILAFSALTLFSIYSFAEQSKGAVVLSHKSWTTQGNDSAVHVIDGHLMEKKEEINSFLALATAYANHAYGYVYKNILTTGYHSYQIENYTHDFV